MLRKLYVIGLVLAFFPTVLVYGMMFDKDNRSAGILVTEIFVGIFLLKISIKLREFQKNPPFNQ